MTCSENGRWEGERAACAQCEEIENVWHNSNHYWNLSDRDRHTCVTSGVNYDWNVRTKKFLVGQIVVKVFYEATSIQDIQTSSSDENLQVYIAKEPCTFYKEEFEGNVKGKPHFYKVFKCRVKTETKMVRISKAKKGWTHINLCEIFIYTRPKTECEPHFPLCNGGLSYTKHSTRIKHGQNVSVYCRKGYKLAGSNHLYCEYGQLIYDIEPKCIEEKATTSQGWIVPVTATVTSLLILVIVFTLFWILCFKKKNTEGIYSEPSASTRSISKETSPPLPPLTTHPFYSDPKDICYYTDDEEHYREPYDSRNLEKTTTSQDRGNPIYTFTQKENVLYTQSTVKG